MVETNPTPEKIEELLGKAAQGKEAHKEEKKKEPSLEQRVGEETAHLGSNLAYSAAVATGAGAATVGAAALGDSLKVGLIDGAIPVLAFPLGRVLEDRLAGKQTSMRELAKEAGAGLTYWPAFYATVKAIEKTPELLGVTSALGTGITVGTLGAASIPILTAAYYPVKYLWDNGTMKGFKEYFKKHYWHGTRRSLYLAPIDAAVLGVSAAMPFTAPYLLPIYAALEIGYRLALSTEKLKYAKLLNPATYLPKILNPAYVGSGFLSASKKMYNKTARAAQSIGYVINRTTDYLGNLLSKAKEAAKGAVSPAPAAQPQHA